jgi:hypothetical protein
MKAVKLARRLLVADLDVVYLSRWRAKVTPVYDLLHGLGLPLKDGFNPPIPHIAHPAGQTQGLGLTPGVIPKIHPLYLAGDKHVSANNLPFGFGLHSLLPQ